jgi:hypothetical protein
LSFIIKYAGEQARRPKREVQGEQALIMKKIGSQRVESASRLIDARIQELGDWRGEMLARLRALIKQADPKVVEEWKWRGTPVWSHDGLICTGETYKNVVKTTFAKGASLDDPSGLFNSSLEGRVRRAIDFREGDQVNEKALKTLIRTAVALNTSASDR